MGSRQQTLYDLTSEEYVTKVMEAFKKMIPNLTIEQLSEMEYELWAELQDRDSSKYD